MPDTDPTGGAAVEPDSGATARSRIVAERASITYDGRNASLADLDFTIDPGRSIALLGPNGGGKTTLVRALSGELTVLSGRLIVEGRIAYLPQTDRTRLDFPVTALDVALMGTLATTPWWRPAPRAARARALDALAQVGLADRSGDLFGRLSGGQRRRALLARTLVQEAPILLLDEPYAGVDAASAAAIDGALDRLHADGVTTLLATHDIAQAERCDRVLCLNHTQIAFGPPSEVLNRRILAATHGTDLTEIDAGGATRFVTTHHHDDCEQ